MKADQGIQSAYPIVVWRPLKRKLANSADPDQILQDQGLHCLQIVQPFFSMNI